VRLRSTLILLIVVSLAAGLAACGNQSSSPSTVSTSSSTSAHPDGAAAFITPQGDNSIPTFGIEADLSVRRSGERALRGYLDARQHSDWARACSFLAETPRRQLLVLASNPTRRVRQCSKAYEILTAHTSDVTRINPFMVELAAFRVKGLDGFALFFGPGGQKLMIPMVREDGDWKANQVAPIAYPVGSTGR
jgi:hypothetical protein